MVEKSRFGKLFLIAAAILGVYRGTEATERSLIFPTPREIVQSGSDFVLNEHAVIAIPAFPSEEDLFLAQSLADDLGDRFAVHLKTERVAKLDPDRRMIVIGSTANPLVRTYCGSHSLTVSLRDPGPEGYILQTSGNIALVAGSDDRGAFFGMQSLRQLARREQDQLCFKGMKVRDWPAKPFRGIKLYIPGRNNIPFFKRFIRDFMALYKYNTLIMEMNASMRFDRHPELNTGWVKFARDTNYSRRHSPPGTPHDWDTNSTHQDTADGGYLEKEEVADLARWVKRYHIELIPELPSFTHCYYLMTAHPDLSETPDTKWPAVYCPSNPASYKLLFDVFDEYIDLLKPKWVHAGHDELFQPVGLCPRCKDKDIGERFGEDVRIIHDYLASRGVSMIIWGDRLLEGISGKGLQTRKAPDGFTYQVAGGMTPEQVNRLIPRDVLIFNWAWSTFDTGDGTSPTGWKQDQVEGFEVQLDQMGFQQVFGNLHPYAENWQARMKRSSIIGGAPSVWFATNEIGFGKDQLSDFLGGAHMLWRDDALYGPDLSGVIQSMMPEIRTRFRGEEPPSATEASIVPVRIAAAFNMGPAEPGLGINLVGMESATATLGKVPFELPEHAGKVAIVVETDGAERTGMPKDSGAIPIGEDATSLIFLHASARPATTRPGWALLWDQDDTADLLGWYEVIYEDGFVTTIPLRYGVNIEEWNWASRRSEWDYCYGADAVPLGGQRENPITFFAFEWKNPRLGKRITEVRLKATTGFRGAAQGFSGDYGPVIPKNAIILKAISVVKKRD
jgi:Glycosyl hydrolase family 20, domain 2/Glycosyl hydrolase family 20, catalytic domain